MHTSAEAAKPRGPLQLEAAAVAQLECVQKAPGSRCGPGIAALAEDVAASRPAAAMPASSEAARVGPSRRSVSIRGAYRSARPFVSLGRVGNPIPSRGVPVS
jgi:hypothetical protein